jgi:hypothetical protein
LLGAVDPENLTEHAELEGRDTVHGYRGDVPQHPNSMAENC